MDAFTVDAAATAGCIAVVIALWRRKPKLRRAPRPPVFALGRSIGQLRRRHRRAVRGIVELAHECLKRHPDGSFEAFTAREALQSYLPETVSAYLCVPRALRRVRRAGRPSADDELSCQLLTLQSGLERIRESDAEIGVTRMAANGAFLGERFASTNPPQALDRRSIFSEFVDLLETALRRT